MTWQLHLHSNSKCMRRFCWNSAHIFYMLSCMYMPSFILLLIFVLVQHSFQSSSLECVNFPLWFESARLEPPTSNRDISAVFRPTVLIFGGQLRVWFLFMPSKFHADRPSRFGVLNRGLRHFHAPSAYGAVQTSTFDNSASTGPISPRFREDVCLDVFYRSCVSHLDEPSRSLAVARGFVAH